LIQRLNDGGGHSVRLRGRSKANSHKSRESRADEAKAIAAPQAHETIKIMNFADLLRFMVLLNGGLSRARSPRSAEFDPRAHLSAIGRSPFVELI
jgi:hypothetical protein